MTSAASNRLVETLGGASAADTVVPMQAHPGVALFFGLLLVAGLGLGLAALAWMIVRRPRTDLLVARPWGAHDALRLAMVLLVLLGAYLSWVALVQRVRPDLAATEAFAATATAAQSVVFHWPILVFAGLRMVRDGTSLRAAFGIEGRRAPAHAGLGAALYPASLPAVAAAAFVAQLAIRRFGIEAGPQEVLRLMMDRGAGAMRFYLIALAVAIAPVAEEILFRGIVMPVLARHTGTVWALVASAAVFAALHMNLAAAAPLFVLGLVLGLAYLYSGSLTVPIALHAVFNSVSITVSHLLPSAAG